MKLNFTFRHLDHSDSLQTYTQEQIDRVAAFILKEGNGQVFFSKKRKEFTVEVLLRTKQKNFHVKTSHFDVYSAVSEATEKLERQIMKVRKINQEHKKYELSRAGKMDQMNQRFELNLRGKRAA